MQQPFTPSTNTNHKLALIHRTHSPPPPTNTTNCHKQTPTTLATTSKHHQCSSCSCLRTMLLSQNDAVVKAVIKNKHYFEPIKAQRHHSMLTMQPQICRSEQQLVKIWAKGEDRRVDFLPCGVWQQWRCDKVMAISPLCRVVVM